MNAAVSVLYDAPGPKARRRYQIMTIVVVLISLVVAVLIVRALNSKGQLTDAKWKPFLEGNTWTTYILPGIEGTLLAAAMSIVLALILGSILGIGRLSEHSWVRSVCGVIVELFRAVPVLILIIFLYAAYAEFEVFKVRYLALAAVVTGLTLYNGSVIAEIVRAGINSLPKGQTEAAQALGMRKNLVMRTILLPQAVTAMLPAIISQMVVALKDSALGYVIGFVEVVKAGQQVGAFYGNYLPSLIVIAIIMIAINMLLTLIATKVELRLRTRTGSKGGPTTVVAVEDLVTV